MKTYSFVKMMFGLTVMCSLTLAGALARADTPSEMETKVDNELIAGNITEEATYTDLMAVLNNAQAAATQEDKDSAKDAYNTLVMVNDGGSIKSEAAGRLVWP